MSCPSPDLKILENCSTWLGLDESIRTIPSSLCNGQAAVNSSLDNSTPNISEEINFVNHSSSDRNCTSCADRNCTYCTDRNCTYCTDRNCTYCTDRNCTYCTNRNRTYCTDRYCTCCTDRNCTYCTDRNCTYCNYRNCTYCTDRNLPQVEQKKQPSNTKLPQEVAVNVTEANHEVMSDNAGTYFHCNLTLILLVTKQNLDSLTTGQTAKQQQSNSLKKRTAALKCKQLCG